MLFLVWPDVVPETRRPTAPSKRAHWTRLDSTRLLTAPERSYRIALPLALAAPMVG
jgi:hypothetical protein